MYSSIKESLLFSWNAYTENLEKKILVESCSDYYEIITGKTYVLPQIIFGTGKHRVQNKNTLTPKKISENLLKTIEKND